MSTLKTTAIQHLNGASPNINLDSSGNVGIGSSPVGGYYKFNINASASLIANGNSGNGYWQFGNSSTQSNNYHIGTEGDGTFRFWNGTYGSGTERMRIDASGRVTKPYQPAFWVEDFDWSSSTQRPHNGYVRTNVGSHYNNTNGYFTTPIAGNYMFICTVQGNNPGETSGRNATYFNLKANINGSDVGNEIVATAADVGGKHDQITHCVLVTLAANDIFYFNSNYGFRVVQNSYIGYLLG